jgi:hypothetical protein
MSLRDRWLDLLDREGSTRAVGLMRVGTGLLLWSRWAAEMMPYRAPEPDRIALSAAFYITSTLMVLGLWSRWSVPAAGAVVGVMVATYGVVEEPTWGHHHTALHMLAVWWLALTPSGRSFSLDRLLAVRRADRDGVPRPAEEGPLWAVPLLAIQVCVLYLWSLVDKLQNGFYTGVQLEQLSMYYVFGAAPPEGLAWLYQGMACTVMVLELLLPIGLWFRRWRGLCAVVGIAMHLAFYVLIPVHTFSAQMIVLYLAFFDADDVHRTIDRLLGYRRASDEQGVKG